MLRQVIERAGGQIVKTTGDGVFAAFETARAGVDTAIAIQQALREHRESTGFALSVRIGLHAAEATRRGDDYSGMAIHVAARIGALASGGEILASAEALSEAGDLATSAPRSVPVRGSTAPVTVASVTWT